MSVSKGGHTPALEVSAQDWHAAHHEHRLIPYVRQLVAKIATHPEQKQCLSQVQDSFVDFARQAHDAFKRGVGPEVGSPEGAPHRLRVLLMKEFQQGASVAFQRSVDFMEWMWDHDPDLFVPENMPFGSGSLFWKWLSQGKMDPALRLLRKMGWSDTDPNAFEGSRSFISLIIGVQDKWFVTGLYAMLGAQAWPNTERWDPRVIFSSHPGYTQLVMPEQSIEPWQAQFKQEFLNQLTEGERERWDCLMHWFQFRLTQYAMNEWRPWIEQDQNLWSLREVLERQQKAARSWSILSTPVETLLKYPQVWMRAKCTFIVGEAMWRVIEKALKTIEAQPLLAEQDPCLLAHIRNDQTYFQVERERVLAQWSSFLKDNEPGDAMVAYQLGQSESMVTGLAHFMERLKKDYQSDYLSHHLTPTDALGVKKKRL